MGAHDSKKYHSSRLDCILRFLLLGNLLLCLSAKEASAQLPGSSHQVLTAIANAKGTPKTKMNAAVRGQAVTIGMYREPNIGDDDCKIDAVLIAKAIIDAFPDVAHVSTTYYNLRNPSQMRSVNVQRSLVESFGKGMLDDKQMLATLTVVQSTRQTAQRSTSNTIETYTPIPGSNKHERVIILERIRKLKDYGDNAEPYFQRLVAIDRDIVAKSKDLPMSTLQKLTDDVHEAMVRRVDFLNKNPGGPAQGPFYERRCAIYKRIIEARENGKDVTSLNQLFQDLESSLTKSSSAQVEDQVRFLENQLRFLR